MLRLARYIFCAVLPLSFIAQTYAEEASPRTLALKEDAPTTYTVVKGDTLWDISALYLDSPWLWPRLWQVNPDIDNPHLIYPGDKLMLIWRNGQPVLSLKSMVKLSPKVRVLEKKAVPTVHEGLVLPYIESDRLINREELSSSVRVLGASDGHKYLTKNDVLYISGIQRHVKWGIYRSVADYQRNTINVVALKRIAAGELVNTQDDFSGLTVLNQQQEILVNDIALPEVDTSSIALTTTFYPTPSPVDSFAQILGSLNGGEYAGQNQVVVIDRGSDDGLRQGSMFELFQEGATVFKSKGEVSQQGGRTDKSTQLPNSLVGSLMVIRPYEQFSLALITNSKVPIGKTIQALSPLNNALPNSMSDSESMVASGKVVEPDGVKTSAQL